MKKLIICLVLMLFVNLYVYAGPWKECRYPDENYHDFIGRIVRQWIDLPDPLEYGLDFTTTLGIFYGFNRALEIRKAESKEERLELSLAATLGTLFYVVGKEAMLFYGDNYDPNRWDNVAFDVLAVGTGFSLSYFNKGYFWIAPKKDKHLVGVEISFRF